MNSLHTQKIELSKQEQTEFELIINKRKTSQSIVFRAKIILSGAQGKSILKTSKGTHHLKGFSGNRSNRDPQFDSCRTG